MDNGRCSHQQAWSLLRADDPEAAIRIAGPMLASNPADLTAWRITARAMFDIGETKPALKNLKSAALALAEDRNPILAIAQIKEIAELGDAAKTELAKIAELYGAGSDRVEEGEIAPPPLPSDAAVDPWGDDLDRQQPGTLGRAPAEPDAEQPGIPRRRFLKIGAAGRRAPWCRDRQK